MRSLISLLSVFFLCWTTLSLHPQNIFAESLPKKSSATLSSSHDPLKSKHPTTEPTSLCYLKPFQKGTIFLSLSGVYFQDLWRDNSTGNKFAGAAITTHFFVLNGLSLGTELYLLDFISPNQDPFFAGSCFTIRWHFLNIGRFSLYVEGGLGFSYASSRVPPPDGTNFNFFQRVGNGATLRITDEVFLFATIGYMHLSNANIQGTKRNPTLNMLGGQLGITLKIASVFKGSHKAPQ